MNPVQRARGSCNMDTLKKADPDQSCKCQIEQIHPPPTIMYIRSTYHKRAGDSILLNVPKASKESGLPLTAEINPIQSQTEHPEIHSKDEPYAYCHLKLQTGRADRIVDTLLSEQLISSCNILPSITTKAHWKARFRPSRNPS